MQYKYKAKMETLRADFEAYLTQVSDSKTAWAYGVSKADRLKMRQQMMLIEVLAGIDATLEQINETLINIQRRM